MTPAEYKSHREQLALSQGELALLLGITRKTVNGRENGHTPINREAQLAIINLSKTK